LKLENMTFIISYAKQGENTGGHIQIDNSNDVFIERDSDIKYDCKAVLSLLAHEICHKYLYKHNIKLYPGFSASCDINYYIWKAVLRSKFSG